MNRTLQRLLPIAGALIGASLTAQAVEAQIGGSGAYDEYRTRATISIGGTARNFTASDSSGGHPDFGRLASSGVGRYVQMAAPNLDNEGKPVYNTHGFKIHTNWRDGAARNIIPTKTYIQARAGDVAGSTAPTEGMTITSAAAFAQWFRTAAGVNVASQTGLTLNYNAGSQSYVYDGTLDNFRGAGSPDYSYSFEADIPFIYENGHDWWVSVRTSGDALVFVDNRLVIDNAGGLGARPALAVDDTILVENSFVVGFSDSSSSAVSTNSGAAGAIQVQNSGEIAGDVLVGPGGDPATGIITARPDSITGVTGSLGARVPIAVVSDPTGMPPSTGNRLIKSTNVTWTGDLHYDALTIRNGSIVTVSGSCRVLCDGALTITQSSEIRMQAGAHLELYARGTVSINNTVTVNQITGDPNNVMIACLGTGGIFVDQNTDVYAHLACPIGPVDIGNSSTVFGTVTAHSARFSNNGQLTGMGGFAQSFGGASMMGQQRIHLDRLAWLAEDRTHSLHVFFANRTGQSSQLRLETSMQLLNVACLPDWNDGD